MKTGLQSSLYNKISLKDEINTALAQNVYFFDIFFDTWTPSEIPADTIQLITNLINSNLLRFTIHLPINFFELSFSTQQEFYSFIHTFKPKTITIHYNTLTYELLKELALIASESNSKLCVENTIPDYHNIYGFDYISFMKEAKRMLNYSNPDLLFSATLDTGHSFVNGKNPEYYIEKLNELEIPIDTVHLHDNDGKSDSHQPLGTGNINFTNFFNTLKTHKIEPFFVIEHWTGFNKSLSYLAQYN